MKKLLLILIILILVGAGIVLFLQNQKKSAPNKSTITINSQTMNITSPAFADNQNIPSKYSCDGDGINPPLEWSGVPQSAQSLALIVSDPDAPNGTWMHWVMWNISPLTTQVAENSVPPGAVQGQASSGQNVYGGPCPPSGTHHYIFTLYALDAKLSIPSYSTADKLSQAMEGHILAQAQLIGLYARVK